MIRLLAAAAIALAAPATAQAPSAVETIALDLSGQRPIAMLSIGGGQPVPVIFDTGASGNVIDADFARSAGLREEAPAMVGTPAGGEPMRGFVTTIDDGRLGDAGLRGVRVVAVPMPAMQALSVKGVFGPGSFSGRLVHLDLGRGEIRVTEKTPALIPSGPASAYLGAGPLSLPGVTVEIGGRSYEAHVDTGQPGMLALPLAMAGEVPLDGELRPAARPARLADGQPRETREGRISGTVRVGPLTLQNPEARFIEGLQRVNVGMAVLRGNTLVLDPAERRSWLVPPA